MGTEREARTENGNGMGNEMSGTRENGSENPAETRKRKGDQLAERMLNAVGKVQELLAPLQRSAGAKHVAEQLWRAATSGGANYAEARGAESRADFIHKIRVATKELREAHYWLQIIQRSNWVGRDRIDDLVGEFDQLIAILVASARTAKAHVT
jgi:four helix bundle protein